MEQSFRRQDERPLTERASLLMERQKVKNSGGRVSPAMNSERLISRKRDHENEKVNADLNKIKTDLEYLEHLISDAHVRVRKVRHESEAGADVDFVLKSTYSAKISAAVGGREKEAFFADRAKNPELRKELTSWQLLINGYRKGDGSFIEYLEKKRKGLKGEILILQKRAGNI